MLTPLSRVRQSLVGEIPKFDAVLLALLAVSLGVNVYFFKWHGAELWPRTGGDAPALPVGAQVPPLEAMRPGGQTTVIRFEESEWPTVLYVLSPKCSWCAKNHANIEHISSRCSGSYRFIAVVLSEDPIEVSRYLADFPLGFDSVFKPTPLARAAYHLGGTPDTIVVDRRGSVVARWVGAFSGRSEREVAAFFRVSLPGLTAGEKKPESGDPVLPKSS